MIIARLCGEYCRLNAITESYLPKIDELLNRIRQARHISKLDLCKGFYQIPMKAQDKDKTALFSPLGKYQFTRMPFGLKNAPATFQRIVDSLF